MIVASYTCILSLVGYPIATLFSSDPAVLSAAGALWPAFCGFLATSGPFALMLGLLRGLGLQRSFALCVLGILWPVRYALVVGVANVGTANHHHGPDSDPHPNPGGRHARPGRRAQPHRRLALTHRDVRTPLTLTLALTTDAWLSPLATCVLLVSVMALARVACS